MTVDYETLVRHLEEDATPTFGLLSSQATPTAEILGEKFKGRLDCLYSPEHGWFGTYGPGEKVPERQEHPTLKLPIRSLYCSVMRQRTDVVQERGRMVIDLPDIGVRCYTYLGTLDCVLELSCTMKKPVTVLDRPIPLGGIVDGPRRKRQYESLVAPLDVPLCHGMTQCELATYIVREKRLGMALTTIAMRDWSHSDASPWMNFAPPSPAIRSIDCAALYPATVFTEAYPSLDCDRHGALAFRVMGAPWLDALGLLDEIGDSIAKCGVGARPFRYRPAGGKYQGQELEGLLLSVEDAENFRPVSAGTYVCAALMRRHPQEFKRDSRPEWMDKLMGCQDVRLACEGAPAYDLDEMIESWRIANRRFRENEAVDLYK